MVVNPWKRLYFRELGALEGWAPKIPISEISRQSQELIGLKVRLDALLRDFVPRRLYGIIEVIRLSKVRVVPGARRDHGNCMVPQQAIFFSEKETDWLWMI